MLNIKEILKVLQSYNINSTTYGPTIYENNSETGICLEVKDSTFGFLLRYFTFKTKEELDTFLKKYLWYKKNHKKFKINLSLDNYEIPNPLIKYTYNNSELELEDMLNFETKKLVEEETQVTEKEKMNYLINIENLTNYLLRLKEEKNRVREEKNNLRIKENELKYNLLEELTTYYGKDKNIPKKAVNLDIAIKNNESNILQKNLDNIRNKPIKDVKEYLEKLIIQTKEEELDEKGIINEYSCLVYKYNIDILNKQINFVKQKIESERNFNIKGSKNHNIDEELKSFLKNNNAPTSITNFQSSKKEEIIKKYNNITDIKNAYSTISGQMIYLPDTKKKTESNKDDVLTNLKDQFDNLEAKEKAYLVLYNSFYKELCEELDYKSPDELKEELTNSYREMESIAFNENNNHFLANYFKYIDFKNIDTYIESILKVKETVTKTMLNLIDSLKIFCIERNNKELLSIEPVFNKSEKIYIATLPKDTKLLYIPDKIIIDNSSELNLISTKNIYLKNNIIDMCDSLVVNKYQKVTKKDPKNDIIITKELVLKNSYIFNVGTIEGA